jgi:hypothetical protein
MHWGDRKEAWKDAKMINDITFQEEMKEFDTDSFKETFINKELLEIAYMDYTNKFKPASHTPEPLSLIEFVTHSKNDERFSNAWGLKIEERELSLEERMRVIKIPEENIDYILNPSNFKEIDIESEGNIFLNYMKAPTKLITVTYNDTTIESYE